MIQGKPAPARYVADRPYSNPEAAGRRLLQHANSAPELHPGRIYCEQVNGPFLFQDGAKPAEYSAGMKWLAGTGHIEPHDSGTFFSMTQQAKDLFA